MAWIFLLIAGVLEVAWAAGLKKMGVAPTWTTGVVTVVALVASMLALLVAMSRLPLGIAYPIWTGIGSVGTVLVSVFIFNQTLSASGMIGVVLLIVGIFLLGSDAH